MHSVGELVDECVSVRGEVWNGGLTLITPVLELGDAGLEFVHFISSPGL